MTVALARIARAPLWRRALAFLRCLRIARVLGRRVRARESLEAQRANAAANQAAWDAAEARRRLLYPSYVRPEPMSMPGDLDRYSG